MRKLNYDSQPLLNDPITARIDPHLPADKRIRLFLQQGGNPYVLQVGDIGVRVEFTDGAPSLQSCMEQLYTTLQ